jgi:4-amino-4-deoxy-L-arabinose transferase-like glycosyltransferase
MQDHRFNIKIAAILFLALFIRLLGIVSRPIWYDEAFSILFAKKGLGAMLYGTLALTGAGSAEEHPLGYYTLLWLWMKLFGESLVAARLLSVLAGLVSVYLVYLIVLEGLSDSKTASLSMFIAALAPFQIHYSQEIRMYSFLGMWLLLATYAYQRGSKTKNWKWWAVFSISAACAQYTHNLAAFYLVPLSLSPLFQKDWKTFQAVILAGIGALVLYFPWLIQLPTQFGKVQQAYWLERPDISKVFTLLLVYITNTPLPGNTIPAVLSIALIVVFIGLLQTVKITRQTNSKSGLWFLYLSFGPPLLLFLFSQWIPVYIERALLASGAIFCIWLAWVLSRTDLSYVVQYSVLGSLLILFGLGIYQHITYHDFPYGPFKELEKSLHERAKPGDIIIHSNKLTLLPAILFDPNLSQTFIGDAKGSGSDTFAPATQKVLGVQAKTDIQAATRNSERVWYIIYQRALNEYGTDEHSIHPDIQFLNSHYTLKVQESWDGLLVYLYARSP